MRLRKKKPATIAHYQEEKGYHTLGGSRRRKSVIFVLLHTLATREKPVAPLEL
jgi:hypothetical protein